MHITRDQIKRLRAEGHRLKLKPVVIIGQKGLSENLHAEIERALGDHELIKLRIPAQAREDKRAFGEALCERHGAALIESIGNVIVIYRRNPEQDRFAKWLA
jgi:RNA-binding protein